MRYLILFLAVIGASAHSAEVKYEISARMEQPFGSLLIGTPLTIEVTLDPEQSGLPIPLIENTRRFELINLTIRSGGEFLQFQRVPGSSDAWIVLGDDSPPFPPPLVSPDFLSVFAEGGPAFSGTLGGVAVENLVIFFQDNDGQAVDGYVLPTDAETFMQFDDKSLSLTAPLGTIPVAAAGTIQSVTIVPLPAALLLMLSGLSVLGVGARRGKRGQTTV